MRCAHRSGACAPTLAWYALSMNWGTVADWVAGVGAIAAVVVALVIASRETRLARQRQEDDEKREARLIVVGEPVFDRATDPNSKAAFVKVINYGKLPILEVIVGLKIYAEGLPAPSTEYFISALVGPGDSSEFEFPLPNHLSGVSVSEAIVTFLDSYGRRWERRGADEPKRLLSYVDPTLPEEIRSAIAANLKASGSHRRRRS
jgi:hypothetical protein